MQLVIVESPTKAKTLGRFLGKEYTIEASMGHVRDLPKSTLGVDIEHDFTPEYVAVKGKEQIVRAIKSKAKTADTIILATDPDREGEAIAHHVREILPISNTTNKPIKRIVFHEITKEAIEEALKSPRDIDTHLVDAQTARRVLDRLVGYKLSPLLWKKIRRGLSAGRVQSVAVRLIVEREREIEKFRKEQYFTIVALLSKPHPRGVTSQHPGGGRMDSSRGFIPRDSPGVDPVEFELIEINGEKIEIKEKLDLYDGEYTFAKTTIDNKEKADAILAAITSKLFTVADVLQKEMHRSPYPPFTTSTLQQEASRRLGFTSKRTMSLAQKLYEEGLITYHRTDSVHMANQAVFAIRAFIEKEYGKKYVNESPRMYKTKQKLAQEAHECIRPTSVGLQMSEVRNQTGNDYVKLYELIWRRAVATQMADAVLESTTVYSDVIASGNEAIPASLAGRSKEIATSPTAPRNDNMTYRFKATGSVVIFDGFLKLYPQALTEQKLPVYSQGETLEAKSVDEIEHETTPPPRYNEASLIATLEEKGIGRPSTYAPIISTIEERRYVEKEDARFKPTPIGVAVNDFLVANFADIDDIPFTVQMEDALDEVAHGQREWVAMMAEFYTPFEKKLDKVEGAERVKIAVEETDEKCPTCGSPLVIRTGRFGKFFACSRFPDCKFTKSFAEETNIECPKCLAEGRKDGKVIVKKTKRGRKFYGCSNYPVCNFAAWKLEDIKKAS